MILDGACGNGSLVWWLHGRGYAHAEGIDLAPEQVEAAARLGIRSIHQGDLRSRLRSDPSSFDVIILRDVLEHFPKDDVLQVLDESRLALRPDGRLILHVPNAESPFFGRIRYGDFTHETAFTESSIRQVLGSCGFSDVQVLPSELMVTSARSMLRRLAWRSIATCYKALIYTEVGRWPRVVTQNLFAVAKVGTG